MYHNVQNLQKNWYFVQAAPLDPRARTLPLPDDLMGELVRFVVAHEVGHTLGFQHNMKASAMYSVAQVRDRNWVKQNGHTPSIMDYSRFNYVAQPEDSIDVADLIPKIGPYDKWATMWGTSRYRTRGRLTTRRQRSIGGRASRIRRRGTASRPLRPAVSDPKNLTEAVGDADAVRGHDARHEESRARCRTCCSTATTTQKGDPYRELTRGLRSSPRASGRSR